MPGGTKSRSNVFSFLHWRDIYHITEYNFKNIIATLSFYVTSHNGTKASIIYSIFLTGYIYNWCDSLSCFETIKAAPEFRRKFPGYRNYIELEGTKRDQVQRNITLDRVACSPIVYLRKLVSCRLNLDNPLTRKGGPYRHKPFQFEPGKVVLFKEKKKKKKKKTLFWCFIKFR